MLQNVKLQNVMLQMNLDVNLIEYPEFSAIGKGEESPFIYDSEKKCHVVEKLTKVNFMSYYNCIQVKRWSEYTGVKNFKLHLTMKGKATISVYAIYSASVAVTYNPLVSQVVESDEVSEVVVNIPETDKALVGFYMDTLEDTEIYSGYYSADIEEDRIRDVNISLVTTTFKKQEYIKCHKIAERSVGMEYIKRNIDLIKSNVLYDGSDLKGHMFVHVIDNDRELDPSELDSEDLKVYMNNNVGGAGGFTRGMIEALELPKKPTHVLLMDDDVMVMPESLFRTYYLLRLLKDEYKKCFLSGAMFDYDIRQKQYEDVGFVHKADGSYGPVKSAMDMRLLKNIVANENYSFNVDDAYAGWWYCCIPVEHIEDRGLPLPVFVRGDDVEFSLRNKPGFIALNGICIWHVGFAGKFNAAMELYQVHRNSFVIQAASGICQDVDFLARVKGMFWKDITRFAYNNAELLIDSIEDYLKGPEYIMHLDGEQSLKEHNAKNEKLVPLAELGYAGDLPTDPYKYESLNLFRKAMYVLTINGHLLPNFMLRRTPYIIAYDWFFVPGKNYMKKTLVAVNKNGGTGVRRTINRKRCFALIKRYRKVLAKYKKTHVEVEQAYRNAFDEMKTTKFWKEYLHI